MPSPNPPGALSSSRCGPGTSWGLRRVRVHPASSLVASALGQLRGTRGLRWPRMRALQVHSLLGSPGALGGHSVGPDREGRAHTEGGRLAPEGGAALRGQEIRQRGNPSAGGAEEMGEAGPRQRPKNLWESGTRWVPFLRGATARSRSCSVPTPCPPRLHGRLSGKRVSRADCRKYHLTEP